MSGVPASLMSATLSPARRRWTSSVDAGAFIMFVQRQQRPFEPKPPQELGAVPRVLGGDHADGGENLARSRRNVAHVADRRRDHVKDARLRHYNVPPRPHLLLPQRCGRVILAKGRRRCK